MGKQERGKGAAQKSPLSDIMPFLWDQGQRSIFCSIMLTQETIFLEWKRLTWVCSTSLVTVLVVCLHIWAEQATVILKPTKIQIIMSSSVNPIKFQLLCQLEMLYCSRWSCWCQGCSLVTMQLAFTLLVVIATQECASDTESISSVLVINCLSVLFCDSSRLGKLTFLQTRGRGHREPLYLEGACRVLLISMASQIALIFS